MAEFIKQTWLFPVIQSVHIIGLTMLVGTICLVDLRLLGFGVRRQAAADLASGLGPWTVGGLLTVFVTGPLLFWSDLTRYLNNPAFVLKMTLLTVALAVHWTLHRSIVKAGMQSRVKVDAGPRATGQKLAAVVSLILWSCVVLAGRAIADFDIRPV